MAATFLAVCGGGLNNKEKAFMVIAWLPKATAQVLQISMKKQNKCLDSLFVGEGESRYSHRVPFFLFLTRHQLRLLWLGAFFSFFHRLFDVVDLALYCFAVVNGFGPD